MTEINQMRMDITINKDHIGRILTFNERLLDYIENFEQRILNLEGKTGDAKKPVLICVK